MNYISNRIPNSFHIFSTYKHQNFSKNYSITFVTKPYFITSFTKIHHSPIINLLFVIKGATYKSYSLYTYYLTFFFQIPIISAETTAPINIEKIYNTGLFTNAITNNPPCGAGNVIWNNIDNAPAILEPTTQLTITRTGCSCKWNRTFCNKRCSHNIIC